MLSISIYVGCFEASRIGVERLCITTSSSFFYSSMSFFRFAGLFSISWLPSLVCHIRECAYYFVLNMSAGRCVPTVAHWASLACCGLPCFWWTLKVYCILARSTLLQVRSRGALWAKFGHPHATLGFCFNSRFWWSTPSPGTKAE